MVNNNNDGNNNSSKRNKNKINGSTSSSAAPSAVNNPEKPKQPQRGLGVAQLEKIRLHGQYASQYASQYANCGILPHQVPHPAFFNPSFQPVPEYHQTGPPQVPNYCYPSSTIPSPSYAFMVGMGDQKCSESQQFNTERWNSNNNFHPMSETQPYLNQAGMVTKHLLNLVEEVKSNSSSNQNYDYIENEEPDLDLKL